jgi:cytoplasmic iron level regulating protein YaaA (DUF328/UPF0246 family)
MNLTFKPQILDKSNDILKSCENYRKDVIERLNKSKERKNE